MNKMHFVEIEMQLHASPYNFDRGDATTSQSYQTGVGLRLATDRRYLLKTYVPLGYTTCFDIKISLFLSFATTYFHSMKTSCLMWAP